MQGESTEGTNDYDFAVPTWDFCKVIPGQMTGRFEDVTTL
jgi:hypothetical protein